MALIVVQAGHVGRTTGATGTGGLDGDPTEQEFNARAALECQNLLKESGHSVRIIKADAPSHQYRGDAFVAIHCDGSTSKAARGASVGYRNDSGRRFAHLWKAAYAKHGWTGFRPDNYTAALAGYYGVKRAVEVGNVKAFVAEAGFLTSPADESMLSFPDGPKRFARAIRDAVNEMFGIPVIEEEKHPMADLTTKQKEELKGMMRSAVREIIHEEFGVTGEAPRGSARTSLLETFRSHIDSKSGVLHKAINNLLNIREEGTPDR